MVVCVCVCVHTVVLHSQRVNDIDIDDDDDSMEMCVWIGLELENTSRWWPRGNSIYSTPLLLSSSFTIHPWLRLSSNTLSSARDRQEENPA